MKEPQPALIFPVSIFNCDLDLKYVWDLVLGDLDLTQKAAGAGIRFRSACPGEGFVTSVRCGVPDLPVVRHGVPDLR